MKNCDEILTVFVVTDRLQSEFRLETTLLHEKVLSKANFQQQQNIILRLLRVGVRMLT